jgi:hypothetical protein
METALTPKVILSLFTRYIGHPIWIKSLYAHKYGKEPEHQWAILSGIKEDALQIQTGKTKYWLPLNEDLKYYEIKLLLKPLARLTERVKKTANSLPVTVFITQYYVQMGYDMPVFISPGHPLNCKYMYELGIADYRTPHEVEMLNSTIQRRNGIDRDTVVQRV